MAAKKIAGIAYPFATYGRGLPQAASGVEVYDSAILALFRTNQRSRVMRPEVGTTIQRLVFENTGPLLQARITQEIIGAVNREIPEVIVQHVDMKETNSLVEVNVFYSVNGIVSQTGNIPYLRG